MGQEILLIRHGKAEERSSAKKDAERQLTPKGKEEFASFVPSLSTYLDGVEKIMVWTSPLVRAKETAGILTDTLSLQNAEEKEFLASGDMEAFLKELQELQEESTVVCVGHEPSLGNWAEEWIGENYSFSKGGAALIELDEEEGKLIWEKKPDSFRKPTEEDEQIKAVLLEQVEALKKRYRDYVNNPYASETVHQFRVSIRRLRALLNFLKPVLLDVVYERLNTRLSDAANRLSPLRDVDVLIEEVGKIALEQPDLIDEYTMMFKFLDKERRQLLRWRTSENIQNFFEETLEETEREITSLRFIGKKDHSWPAFVEKRLAKEVKKLQKQYEKADFREYESTHSARKQGKKVRYAADGFKEWVSKKEAKKYTKQAKNIQNSLGKICDTYVLQELLEEYAEKASEKAMQNDFSTLSDYLEEQREALIQDE